MTHHLRVPGVFHFVCLVVCPDSGFGPTTELTSEDTKPTKPLPVRISILLGVLRVPFWCAWWFVRIPGHIMALRRAEVPAGVRVAAFPCLDATLHARVVFCPALPTLS